MAFEYLLVLILIDTVDIGFVIALDHTPITEDKFDSKRSKDLVDEAFLEQKDVLLNMLESKLKDVVGQKKKKTNTKATNSKCEIPVDVDINLKSNGISAVGEAEVLLKFGSSGKSTLDLDATGVSNVGKSRLKIGLDNGAFEIPGIYNLFSGKLNSKCDIEKESESENEESITTVSVDNITETTVAQNLSALDANNTDLDIQVVGTV